MLRGKSFDGALASMLLDELAKQGTILREGLPAQTKYYRFPTSS